MVQNVLILGRGIGQVMFQNNALSGLLMLIGIACNSWQLAVLAVVGTLVGTLTAYLSDCDRTDVGDGLYGFNGALVGIAVGVFMEITVESLLLLTAGAALSTWVARCFRRQSLLPGFTAPFILVVWLLLIGCRYLYPSLLLEPEAGSPDTSADFFRSFCLNIGQVMFQGNILTGLFFLAGILVNSRLNAVYAVIGAALPLAMILLPDAADVTVWNAGLWGYNGVLCAIALGSSYAWRGMVRTVLSVLLSIVLQWAGMQMGMVTLTAPFVLSVWIVGALWRGE